MTRSLGYESRCRMKDLIQNLRGKTTVLLVSHDPEIVALCDEKIDLTMSRQENCHV